MSSQTRGGIQHSEGVAKEKRKPVRRDPEKRRQQNIKAQKRYREKLRERLSHLEALEATQHASFEETLAVRTATPLLNINKGTQIAPSFVAAEDLSINEPWDIHSVSQSSGTQDFNHIVPQFEDTWSAFSTWGSTADISQSDGTSSVPSIWDSTNLTSQSETDTPPSLTLWDTTALFLRQSNTKSLTDSSNSTTIAQVDPSNVMCEKQDDGSDPCWTTNIDCGCPSPHIQIRTQGPDPFTLKGLRVLSFTPTQRLADPYVNTLRLETVCTIAALFNLGMHIGITEEMICAENCRSPFYRSGVKSDPQVEANTIGSVKSIFKALKPDLRPSSEQITVEHHPYIDILPFPTLRKNIIRQQHLEEFDEDQFFLDLLAGLVCWGGAGVGKKDRDLSTGFASTGTPWDVRSWEAKLWFLKKYWDLLGGEDGELVRQSEWWRGIRGEDTPTELEV
ncbi:uncharacterized protein N7511_003366 [Penicillium nucicola]|uniref:uncharacterized protein n=1 Tax=Penicillium nucicola TaxID=1850975 RepID=UPI0025456869|nr:uncharacterized protein N7511_003366 [Penicillium nucicola]KAJ5771315.1 hypothetical protein N7511_003366 [Penicillium nucicola]